LISGNLLVRCHTIKEGSAASLQQAATDAKLEAADADNLQLPQASPASAGVARRRAGSAVAARRGGAHCRALSAAARVSWCRCRVPPPLVDVMTRSFLQAAAAAAVKRYKGDWKGF